MKKTLTTHDIAEALYADEYANWSRAGALALAEWLEEMEDSTGEERELDVVAIRCDFSEHDSLTQWAHDYLGLDTEDDMSDDELDDMIRKHIHAHGWLIEFDGGVIVSAF